jgi:phage terminase large subunit-like protein
MSSWPQSADPVTDYARDVVAGRYVVGRLVRLAAERHLRDLDTGPARGLRWDAVEAAAAIEFWECCPHLKGRAAKGGQRLQLEPWQVFVVGSVYGWRRADGFRRFRVAWVELARKNGKTTLIYPALLYGLALDGEEGAEVYAVATKRDQAKLVFDLAKRAVTRTPDLASIITPYAFDLRHDESFSKCEPVSADADTLDGLNPSVAVCDEIHKWRGRALWDVIETGMGAREQPLMWAITTAGGEGDQDVYGQEHDHGIQVLDGVIEDDARFVFIAAIDPEDDWTDPACWAKANPNLGVSVDPKELAAQVKKAQRTPAAANAVLRLRLGRRTQDADAWIPLPLWDAGRDPRATWAALRGYPCFGGLDLASTSDFAALALCFPLTADWRPAPDLQRPDLCAYLFRLWIPRDGVSHRETKLREIVRPWADAGWIRETDGDAIDHGVIEADLIGSEGQSAGLVGPPIPPIAEWFDLRGLAYDPHNAAMLATRLQAAGVEVTKLPPQMAFMAGPTQQFEADLINGRMRHDGNPCVRWMANNVVVVSNGAGHQMPARKRSRNKIDAIVAGVIARGRAMAGGDGGASWYDTNGVEVV